jgi:hypothetical protein
MKCPHCSKDISPNAKSCPHCGETDPLWGKVMSWLIGATIVVFGGLYLEQHNPWVFYLLLAVCVAAVILYVMDFKNKR